MAGFPDSFDENILLHRTAPKVPVDPLSDTVKLQGEALQKEFLKPNRASILSLMRSSETKVVWDKGKHKCDPVTRYHEYKAVWERYKIPGEKAHKQLRWNVRAHMLRKDDVVTVSHD